MSKKTYKRFHLAANQLETAIMLFITGGDKFSVITLAGAADVIFCELVIRKGEKTFTDSLREKNNKEKTRQQIGREINDTLGINACKHLDPGEEEYVLLDIEESALGAILKAIVNYDQLKRKNQNLTNPFFYWLHMNVDPKKYKVDCWLNGIKK
ncbi:Uncharacterised protein [Legionella donaldsonii]|uniref:Uncharacterized protein n=1 Tax=Legionella donaldsonii TaxID=45060 RepID=A0A378J733_9GAMM|nr:hypothetical protein [Legionella donaldsonii]STX40330.1 Uncharacterised protein [Legionella donaldsonii]